MGDDPDVLVIGGGVAGLSAAIAARRLGARVRLVESAPLALRGGDARHARNFRFCHDAPVWHTPARYPKDEFLDELKAAAGVETALARPLVEASADLPGWLVGCGVRLQSPEVGVIPYSRRTAFLHGGGKTMLNALYRTAAEAGVDIRYQTQISRLRRGARTWTAERDGAPACGARAVVIASGGPGGDPGFLRAHLGPVAEGLTIRGGAASDGRLMRALVEELGVATVGDPTSCHMVAVDARGPRFDGGVVTRIKAIPYGVVVDREGAPLIDPNHNDKRSHYAEWGPRVAAAPGGVAYLILDEAGLRRADPIALPPLRADRLTELDSSALATTLAERALAPPYFVVPLRAGVTFAHFGLAVAEDLGLIARKESSTAGLYAAGMIMAANILPRGYLAGLGLTLSAVAGRRAGEAAARHARV